MREPLSVRQDAHGGRDENARQGVVDANRLGPPLALTLEDDYDVALEGDITGKMRCFRSLFEAKR